MFKVIIYKNAQGNQPIKEYLTDLAQKTDKDSRIKLAKIDYYLQALREYGTRTGEPFVKHVDGDIWELRPLNDRFFFFHWNGRQFVLLHHYVKKAKKAPQREITQAKRNMKDFIDRSENNAE
ncbi:MAG: type II toxin-antitoxin system RelE/ParE family toxin [Oscillospiraceae bacterium]|nr:type II toxin-antitoxin system RelE/ParE family toxin [Oscillospiraceae bacterium]